MSKPDETPVQPAEELKEVQEVEDGIPVPPGYTLKVANFGQPKERNYVAQRMEHLGKSITFTPLVESVKSILTLLFMGGWLVAALGAIADIVHTGFRTIAAAGSPNHRLNMTNRMMMVSIGFGLLLFVLWRASSMGLVGAEAPVLPPAKPPLFMEVR